MNRRQREREEERQERNHGEKFDSRKPAATVHRLNSLEVDGAITGPVGMRLFSIIDGQEAVAGPGDIVVVAPEASHRFTAIGDERLHMVCIHASDRFIIEWL